jgi:hypothetical protein
MNRTMQSAITQTEYGAFQTAYDFFNAELYGESPHKQCVLVEGDGNSANPSPSLLLPAAPAFAQNRPTARLNLRGACRVRHAPIDRNRWHSA